MNKTYRTPERFFSVFLPLFLILTFCAGISPVFAADYYWEAPRTITTADSRFPSSASSAAASVIVWQEVDTKAQTITLSARVFSGGVWIERPSFAGPFSYSGDIPAMSSAAVNKNGEIVVTALSGVSRISIFTLNNPTSSFTEDSITNVEQPLVGARVFSLSDGSFIVLATQGVGEAFSLVSSLSHDGKKWTEFAPFAPAKNLTRAFVPTIVPSADGDITIFQTAYEHNFRLSYQLYSSVTKDGGKTWSEARLITDSPESDGLPFTSYNNQRPAAATINGVTHLVWERSSASFTNSQIFYAPLNPDGTFAAPHMQVSTPALANCSQPAVFSYRGAVCVLWFDTRSGIETVYLAQKDGLLWDETRVSAGNAASLFALPVFIGNELNIVWQQNTRNGSGSIVFVSPDYSVLPPSIRPLTYAAGRRSNAALVQFQLSFPSDSSGVAGYSWIWTQDKNAQPPETLMQLSSSPRITVEAVRDGYWYLKARITDYAGNWSVPAEIAYYRDTTPPEKPLVLPPAPDPSGYLASNTFGVTWEAQGDDEIAGYTYRLEYVLPPDAVREIPSSFSPEATPPFFTGNLSKPPARVMTEGNSVRYVNADNGLYAFSVCAIDTVGNISEPAAVWLYLNKYIPYTVVNTINASVGDTGIISLAVLGRGFLADGSISTIYIDRDGIAPYDRVLERNRRDFTIISDSLITGITLSDLEEGSYRVGLLHTSRGLYMSRQLFLVDSMGTVKFGDYSRPYEPDIQLSQRPAFLRIQVAALLAAALCLFAALSIPALLRGIARAAADTVQVRREIQALLTGDVMPSEKKRKTTRLRQRGISLKYKLMGFTAALVLMIILLVSLPLGYYMVNTQEETLAKGLESQIGVLLDSLSSGVRAYLPQKNILELGYLPGQSKALKEALSATITGGPASGGNINLDYVWATNDPDILGKIASPPLVYGTSRLNDELSRELEPILADLNGQAAESAGALSTEIEQLTREALSLVLKTDAASVRRREEIQTITSQLDDRVTTGLNELASSAAGSYPEFDNRNLSSSVTEYVFYKPVLYRQGAAQDFVRGTVRVTVSTESLLNSVRTARNGVILMTLIIAFVAIAIGVVGSLTLASIIISPIRRLASHVALIRDTEDKEKLDGRDIAVKSKDEIGLLGEIVNDMTHGLVKAAAAAKDLTVGKELQKMFIPLEIDSTGKKLTTGKILTKNLEFFGYYEGAKGVSGDYFDVQDLDGRHYAVIKCDVAGKGVPASLIMVEVATLFLDYFKDWTYKTHGYDMSAFVARVNDMIESRGFKGRFAAFSLCILDSATGDVHFCNAGDNMLHFYKAADAKKITETVPETPAAGVFPTFMLEMKGGYKMVKRRLQKGDVLFMYTDGIEEAKRMFRDANYTVIVCAEPGLEAEAPHESHSVGQDSEEMGAERVNAIIEAVFSRSVYSLIKWHNPVGNELLEFDFSDCGGTVEDCLMALVSVEKIFRMYREPKATEHDRVLVDRKIDEFLNLHFKQYAEYCSNRRDHSEFPEYLWYTHMKEDPQYDDLTLLGIRKL